MDAASEVIERCRRLALMSEEPGFTTRTFLSEPMRAVYSRISEWMRAAGMETRVDDAGNLHGVFDPGDTGTPRLYIGSHLDTVPHAGAFDGILGVLLGIAIVDRIRAKPRRLSIEVLGFSEEEGVRFGVPFIGSRAFIGQLDSELREVKDREGISIAEAIRAFGLWPEKANQPPPSHALGYLEFHIEQGPVLEAKRCSLGIVESIAGQSRFRIVLKGRANHAGTTPMNLRHDAMAGTAEWITQVEAIASNISGLVATVGQVQVIPGASNVIAGEVRASLDVRHGCDAVRLDAVQSILASGREIAARRGLSISVTQTLNQPAVPMDVRLAGLLDSALRGCGVPASRLTSGAGHDAMIVARAMPTAMLFLRSPGGVSHHPDETVLPEDVAAAIEAGAAFVSSLETTIG